MLSLIFGESSGLQIRLSFLFKLMYLLGLGIIVKTQHLTDFLISPVVFPFVIWKIWKMRNKKAFGEDYAPLSIEIKNTKEAITEFYAVMDFDKKKTPKCLVNIHWKPTDPGKVKINTDGASHGNPGLAGAGGLIRDSNGVCLRAFSRKLGVATSTCAELWAIRDALQCALNAGYNDIVLESDSKVAINLLSNCFNCNHAHYALIHDCRCLMDQLNIHKVEHTYREGNGCADILAKAGCFQDDNFILYNETPDIISTMLLADQMGISLPRFCNVDYSFDGITESVATFILS